MAQYEIQCGDKTIPVKPVLELYQNVWGIMGPSVGLAIELLSEDKNDGPEPFSGISVCFGEHIGIKNTFYADLNNAPWAEQLIKQGFATDTGYTKHSGFCEYPLWRLTDKAINDFKADPLSATNYTTYEKAFARQMGF